MDVFLSKSVKRISSALKEDEAYQDMEKFKTTFLREASLFSDAFRESYHINKMKVID